MSLRHSNYHRLFWQIAILASSVALPGGALADQSQNWIWNVMQNGSAVNGCVYAGAQYPGGTDRSQQAAAQLVIVASSPSPGQATAVVSGSTITFTGGTYTPSVADIGNGVQIPPGITGITAGMYAITAESATTWTLDRSSGASSPTALYNTYMGGSCDSLNTVNALETYPQNEVIYVKYSATPYIITATQTLKCHQNNFYGAWVPTVVGYNTTHNDEPTGANRPVIQVASGSAIDAITIPNNSACGWTFRNLIIDGNCTNSSCGSGQHGINAQIFAEIVNVEIRNFLDECVYSNYVDASDFGIAELPVSITRSNLHGCNQGGGTATVITIGDSLSIKQSWIHDPGTPVPGIAITQNPGPTMSLIWDSWITGFTGNTADCVIVTTPYAASGISIVNSDFWNCGRDAVRISSGNAYFNSVIRNNIFAGYGEYGFNLTDNTTGINGPWPQYHPNAYYPGPGALGPTHNLSTSSSDITLTAIPYNNAPYNDYTLNSNSPGGAQLKGSAAFGLIPNGASVLPGQGISDFGAWHAERVYGTN